MAVELTNCDQRVAVELTDCDQRVAVELTDCDQRVAVELSAVVLLFSRSRLFGFGKSRSVKAMSASEIKNIKPDRRHHRVTSQ
jgi:hypothetical protein